MAIDNCRLHSSQWTGFLSARYETQPLDLGLASGSFGLQVDWAPRSKTHMGFDPTVDALTGAPCSNSASSPCPNGPKKVHHQRIQRGPFGLLNANLTWYSSEMPLEISLWGRNLNDKEYETAWIDFGGFIVSYQGAPREYGLNVTYRWE